MTFYVLAIFFDGHIFDGRIFDGRIFDGHIFHNPNTHVKNVESKNTLKNALARSGAEINDFICFGHILEPYAILKVKLCINYLKTNFTVSKC